MKLNISHLDITGNLNDEVVDISYPAFIKHMAFCGLGVNNSILKSLRYTGYYFEYLSYWSSQCFRLPPVIYFDPTEKGQISNKIGKAFSDFLAKKYYKARFTHNYEHAMVRAGFPLKGSRPDFYCDTLSKQFAIEAKGSSSPLISKNKMDKVKIQSQKGPLPVNFSIASVSYNLYHSPSINFWDPEMPDTPYNEVINAQLRHIYYKSIIDLIEMSGIERVNSNIHGYYEYDFQSLNELLPHKITLLLHNRIAANEWGDCSFLHEIESVNEGNIYIDLDGIGIKMANK